MNDLTLYYATNRNHLGAERWHPDGYGNKFSNDGTENLRFGKITVPVNAKEVDKSTRERCAGGVGDGESLSGYLSKQVARGRIDAFEELIDPAKGDSEATLGSQAMFLELQTIMEQSSDVLIFIHGFNVKWHEAVGSALALQHLLNLKETGVPARRTQVVLFTWPSDGLALPFVSYKSDRTEAAGSGYAVGRAFLKLRDFLVSLRDRACNEELCGQDLHLLCHSMGNFVLQNALARLRDFTPGSSLPRLFEHIFLCAPDVDDSALESNQPMHDLHELARCITVYHNRGDVAMYVSDYTKGNPDRLGTNGAARPASLHNKVHQLDCSPVVKGLVEHSYYLCGLPNRDVRMSIAGLALDAKKRDRVRDADLPNVWSLPRRKKQGKRT